MNLKVKNGVVYLDTRKLGSIRLINGKRTFVSYRTRERAYFRIYEGFGISVDLLKWLELQGVTDVLIVLTDTNEKLSTTVEKFKEFGMPYHHRIYEKQLILSERYFQ